MSWVGDNEDSMIVKLWRGDAERSKFDDARIQLEGSGSGPRSRSKIAILKEIKIIKDQNDQIRSGGEGGPQAIGNW